MATRFHGENRRGRRAIGMKRTFDQLKPSHSGITTTKLYRKTVKLKIKRHTEREKEGEKTAAKRNVKQVRN